MPSTPRAITIPKIVAQVMTADELGWSFFDSTESCVVDAASSALLIWEALNGCEPWTSQSFVVAWMWNSSHRVLGDHRVRRRGAARQGTDLLDDGIGEAVGRRAAPRRRGRNRDRLLVDDP